MKIGLLCSSSLSHFNMEVLRPILSDCTMDIAVAYVDNRLRPSFRKRFVKNLKRGRGGYMFVMFYKKYFGKKEQSYSVDEFCENNGIDLIKSDNPYSENAVDKLKSYNLDVIVSLGGFGIVKEPLLSLTEKGILSYHHGNMRKYRGQPVAFWELYNGEKEMGVTVQKLSKGIDTGTPIEEITIPISKKDNVSSLSAKAMLQSVGMMYKALLKIDAADYIPQTIDSYGKNYTIPNLRQYIHLKIKLLFRNLY